jgi:hypothetical protein
MKELSDKTLVPLGIAIATIGAVAWWAAVTTANGAATDRELSQVKVQLHKYSEDVTAMRSDLAVIKDRVESMNNKLKWRDR